MRKIPLMIVLTPFMFMALRLSAALPASAALRPSVALSQSPALPPLPNAAPFVIPALREWQGGTGNFILGESAHLVIDPEFADSLSAIAGIFRQDLETMTGRKGFAVRKGKPAKGDIYLTLRCTDKGLGNEGYDLED